MRHVFMNVKEKLEKEFGSEVALRIVYRDYNTGKSEDDMSEIEKEDCEIYAYLPNGTDMGKCTNCARYIRSLYPHRTEVYGFLIVDNPRVTHKHVLSAFGHDFAVLDSRYIVDPWISSYVGAEDKTVYDMQSKDDRAKIIEVYGESEYWAYMKDDNFVRFNDDDFPSDKRIRYPKLKKK